MTYYIKTNKLISGFAGWQAGYGAFTHSAYDRDRLTEYVKRQDEHHRKVSFADELRTLLIEAGVDFDELHLSET